MVRVAGRDHAAYRADRTIHLIGLTVAPVAVAGLMLEALSGGSRTAVLGVSVYGAALLAMLACSALYNLLPGSPRREWLRRFDHAAIFLMIAGTYTPFSLLFLPGEWGWAFCAAVWSVAVGGAALKIAFPRRFERLSVVLYLALGWSVLVVIDPLTSALTVTAGILLLTGGVLYSIGVVFHLWHRLPYQNAIWHGFVLLAVGCHFAAVAIGVASPDPMPAV